MLATSIVEAEGWPLSAVLVAFSAGQLVAAGTGVLVGRRLDTHGPRALMTSGSVLAALGLAALAASPNLAAFVAAWLLLGPAMAATFYPAAFAAATGWAGSDARARLRALTAITLVGGLASTVFAPLTAVLEGQLGWRGAYAVLAGVVALTTVPLHWWGLRRPWPARPAEDRAPYPEDPNPAEPGPEEPDPAAAPGPVDHALARLTATLGVGALGFFTVVVLLVPMLQDRGVTTTTASIALGLGGLGQVLGRLGYAALVRRLSVPARARVVLLLGAATTAALAAGGPTAAVLALALLAGAARGLFTLVQATSVSDRWGPQGYGRRNGVVAAGGTAATALAPAVGAALLALTGSYAFALLLLAGATALAAAASPGHNPTP